MLKELAQNRIHKMLDKYTKDKISCWQYYFSFKIMLKYFNIKTVNHVTLLIQIIDLCY